MRFSFGRHASDHRSTMFSDPWFPRKVAIGMVAISLIYLGAAGAIAISIMFSDKPWREIIVEVGALLVVAAAGGFQFPRVLGLPRLRCACWVATITLWSYWLFMVAPLIDSDFWRRVAEITLTSGIFLSVVCWNIDLRAKESDFPKRR